MPAAIASSHRVVRLDDGLLWPTSSPITGLDDAVRQQLVALLERAVA